MHQPKNSELIFYKNFELLKHNLIKFNNCFIYKIIIFIIVARHKYYFWLLNFLHFMKNGLPFIFKYNVLLALVFGKSINLKYINSM